jgi:hypothetical protein
MRKKEWKVVITFKTATGAMNMEKFCKENSLSGRLIPVPRQIHAGCGLAWCAQPELKDIYENAMNIQGLLYENIYVIEI